MCIRDSSFFVDYMGYRPLDGDFASPVLAITFAYDPLDALQAYTEWLDKSGFSTQPAAKDVYWHHLPIFCGWAEQTVESVPKGEAPNKLATQANYEKWLSILNDRNLPVGTVVIDDKWQQAYGTFEVDEKKWPDLKGFAITLTFGLFANLFTAVYVSRVIFDWHLGRLKSGELISI